MDTNPHTHNPRLSKAWTTSGLPGPWKVTYGDQEVTVCHGWFGHRPSPEQLKKAIEEAVAKHDKGSVEALDSHDMFVERIHDGELFSLFTEKNDYGRKIEKKEWGSEILNANSKTDNRLS